MLVTIVVCVKVVGVEVGALQLRARLVRKNKMVGVCITYGQKKQGRVCNVQHTVCCIYAERERQWSLPILVYVVCCSRVKLQ